MSSTGVVRFLIGAGHPRGALDRCARIVLLFAYMAVIFYFSSLPASAVTGYGIDDRVAHTVEYFGLGMLLVATTAAFVRHWSAETFAMVFGLSIAHALVDEWHQSFSPGRDVSGKDVLFDALGSVLAITLAWVLIRSDRR